MAVKTENKKERKPAKSKVKSIKVSGIKDEQPTEEDIRELAEIMYHRRIANGEEGTAEVDWYKAEQYLRINQKDEK
jgi:hypothetical protein